MADYRYRIEKRLPVIPVHLYGKGNHFKTEFIVDTGASYTVLDHTLVDILGYSVREGIGISQVSSVIGKETGYKLILEGISALGKQLGQFEVACHDLKPLGIEGLLGMSFLEKFAWCINPTTQIITVVEKW